MQPCNISIQARAIHRQHELEHEEVLQWVHYAQHVYILSIGTYTSNIYKCLQIYVLYVCVYVMPASVIYKSNYMLTQKRGQAIQKLYRLKYNASIEFYGLACYSHANVFTDYCCVASNINNYGFKYFLVLVYFQFSLLA